MMSGDSCEWQAATCVFVANSANLMRSIRGVLKASKDAQALPNNCLSTATDDTLSTTPQTHPQSSATECATASQEQLLITTPPTHIPPPPSLLASQTHFTHTDSPHGQSSPPPPVPPPAAISCSDMLSTNYSSGDMETNHGPLECE